MQQLKLNEKTINFKGFDATMPLTFPSDLINFQVEEIKEIGMKKINQKNSKVTKKKTLTEIVDQIYAKYPSFDIFNAKEYRKYFPKMTDKEIENNSEIVQQYIEKLMAYDVADTFSKEGDGIVIIKDKRNKNGKVGTWVSTAWKFITQCENWYYLAHLRMSYDGLCSSKDKALDLSVKNATGVSGASNDQIDALRHGIWGTLLGKYACYRYGNVPEAFSVAYGFLNSHECFENSVTSEMDRKNNDLTMRYYLQNAERYKYGFLDYDVRVNKTGTEIVNDIVNKGYVKVADSKDAVRNADVNKLVHIN